MSETTRTKIIPTTITIPLPTVMVESIVLDKQVKKIGNTGCVYLPKKLVGKEFKIVLIPKQIKQLFKKEV